MKPKLVVLSGAGVSAESGIPTFRGSDGLWEGHRIEEVATFEAWAADQEKVLRFYNERRKGVMAAKPNAAHKSLAELENHLDVQIITQNIDDLHERGGSSKVLHLHGSIMQARSTLNEHDVYDLVGWEMKVGDTCKQGAQLRPHIVWFGEQVPMIDPAVELVAQADFVLVIGTSLVVYPAAGLVQAAPLTAKVWIIDPHADTLATHSVIPIADTATAGMLRFKEELLALI